MGAVINAWAEVGEDSAIGTGSIIGARVVIGESTVIGSQVSLQNCVVGSNVILHSGVKIGQDGECRGLQCVCGFGGNPSALFLLKMHAETEIYLAESYIVIIVLAFGGGNRIWILCR